MKEFKIKVGDHIAHVYARTAKSAVKTAANLYYEFPQNCEVM